MNTHPAEKLSPLSDAATLALSNSSTRTATPADKSPISHKQLLDRELPRAQTITFTISGTEFEIDRKYKLLKPIGHGAYGVVM